MSRGNRQIPMRQQRKIRKERNKRPAASCKANVTRCTALHCTAHGRMDGRWMRRRTDGRTGAATMFQRREKEIGETFIKVVRVEEKIVIIPSSAPPTDRATGRPVSIQNSCLSSLYTRIVVYASL